MKIALSFPLLAFFLCQSIIAQNNAKIDVDLLHELTLRESRELIRINIILNQQYDQNEMRLKSNVFPTSETRRDLVVGELKRFTGETQQELMNVLSIRNDVSEIQSYWIANFINCYANIEAIKELSLHPDVLIIGFDKEYSMIPNDEIIKEAYATREITYNVMKVKADEVWELGFKGENVVVAVLDTGVNYNHEDLSTHMWTHPNYPYHGWNFVNNTNNPMDDHGHGTRCAGIIAGDGSSGSKTGVAPKSLLMAIKIFNSSGNGGSSAMCSGFQFAVENGAQVINLSGGIPQEVVTEADKIALRNTMVNVLEAGVIATVAAGNEGPDFAYWFPPNSVRCPSSCPPPWLHNEQILIGGLSSVVSVGSTDIDDKIARSSSRGPVTWQDITGYNDYPHNPEMGLMRPDVCAPGVDIKSLNHTNNTGYVSGFGGTSYAAPCVAGTIALMLSKNPYLTPAEICKNLETYAVHLPDDVFSKNNIYGSGRINAYHSVIVIRNCVKILSNKKITTNTTVLGCDNLNVENVTVSNGAKLTLEAPGSITINGPFSVSAGSKFSANSVD
ncbi:MAG: S8 family serine peptidase [Marinilabiliaceae bacterium]|nr:S8 family serine peptidase [Marinilabiliaceae bacterium]